jgi:hypothetical protein
MLRSKMRRLGRKLIQLSAVVVCLIGIAFSSGTTRVHSSQLTAAKAANMSCIAYCQNACRDAINPNACFLECVAQHCHP